jgi:hypothetical protein
MPSQLYQQSSTSAGRFSRSVFLFACLNALIGCNAGSPGYAGHSREETSPDGKLIGIVEHREAWPQQKPNDYETTFRILAKDRTVISEKTYTGLSGFLDTEWAKISWANDSHTVSFSIPHGSRSAPDVNLDCQIDANSKCVWLEKNSALK